MKYDPLIQESLGVIKREINRARRPVALSSFGKDSMTLLYLLGLLGRNIPVMYFRAFAHPTKHQFADQITRDWNLTVVEPRPMDRDVVGKGGHVEIIEEYRQTGDLAFYFPIEAEPGYAPDSRSLCAIQRLNAPKSPVVGDYDTVLIGHRGDDVDPIHGAIPLRDHVSVTGGVRMVYPLKNWTEADIWRISRDYGIPQNMGRYAGGDMTANNDYYPLCTACIESKESSVQCPKFGVEVFGLGALLQLETRAASWRRRFVNIQPSGN